MESARHYLGLIGRHWKILLLTALIASVAAVGVTLALPKTYESEARVLVSASGSTVDVFGSALPELSAQRDNNVATQAELLRSRTLFESVIRRLGLSSSPGSLMRRVKIAPVNQTAVISIVAKADTPETAADIANTLADEYLLRFRDLKHRSLQQASSAIEAEVSAARQALQAMDAAAAAQGMTSSQVTERQAAADRLTSLSAKFAELQVNMRVEEGWGVVTDEAVADATPLGPTPVSSGLVGLLAGLLFGLVYVLFTGTREDGHADAFPREATLLVPPLTSVDSSMGSEKGRAKQLL